MEPKIRDMRFEISPDVLKVFAEYPRIILKPVPGLWPIDLKTLPMLERMLSDREFSENWEIIVAPRV